MGEECMEWNIRGRYVRIGISRKFATATPFIGVPRGNINQKNR